MPAPERPGSLSHAGQVERPTKVVDISVQERARHSAGTDLIPIRLLSSGIPSVKGVVDQRDVRNSDIRINVSVDRVAEPGRFEVALQRETGNLTFGVHAGIGTPGAVYRHGAMVEQRKN